MLRGDITLTLEEIDTLKKLAKSHQELAPLHMITKLNEWKPENGDNKHEITVEIDEVERVIDTLQGIIIDHADDDNYPGIEKLVEKLREFYQKKQEEAKPEADMAVAA